MELPKEFFTIIDGIWPMLVIFIIIVTTIRIMYITEKGEKFVLYKEFFTLLFQIYILLLFGLVTNTDVQSVGNNFMPFREILRYTWGSKHFMWNVVGNIIIFIPFGFIVSLVIDSKRVGKPLIATLISSLTIELVQLFIGRSFDIDDIILNCTGGIIGYFLYIGLSAIKHHLPSFLQKDIVYNILTGLIIILIIFAIFNLWELIPL